MMWLRGLTLAAFGPSVLVLLCAAGCGVDEADDVPFGPEVIGADYYRGLSDYQKERLDDGELTFEEYEEAMLALRACVDDAGLIFDYFDLDPETRRYWYAYGVPLDSPIQPDEVERRYRECNDEYASAIDGLWQTEFGPPTTVPTTTSSTAR